MAELLAEWLNNEVGLSEVSQTISKQTGIDPELTREIKYDCSVY